MKHRTGTFTWFILFFTVAAGSSIVTSAVWHHYQPNQESPRTVSEEIIIEQYALLSVTLQFLEVIQKELENDYLRLDLFRDIGALLPGWEARHQRLMLKFMELEYEADPELLEYLQGDH